MLFYYLTQCFLASCAYIINIVFVKTRVLINIEIIMTIQICFPETRFCLLWIQAAAWGLFKKMFQCVRSCLQMFKRYTFIHPNDSKNIENIQLLAFIFDQILNYQFKNQRNKRDGPAHNDNILCAWLYAHMQFLYIKSDKTIILLWLLCIYSQCDSQQLQQFLSYKVASVLSAIRAEHQLWRTVFVGRVHEINQQRTRTAHVWRHTFYLIILRISFFIGRMFTIQYALKF